MSERTFDRRFARSRASEMLDERRFSSRRCSDSTSRWRARLFCLSAEEVRVASESRRRVSWPINDSRCEMLDMQYPSLSSPVVGKYLLEETLDLTLYPFFFL